MKAVIVTGSRMWPDATTVHWALGNHEPDVVIHGACPGGADEAANRWCDTHQAVACLRMLAQWTRLGRKAGPLRNDEMLYVLLSLQRVGYTVGVLAFPMPQSKGTRHMMRIAREAGVPVFEFAPSDYARWEQEVASGIEVPR